MMRRLYAVIGFGLTITVALLLFTTSTVWAHPCDDNYAEQQDRESCWWRFWNDQSTPEDMMMSDDKMMDDGMMMSDDKMMDDGMMGDTMMATPMMTSMFDGMVCNTHYTEQQDRENCWWRFHNDLPPIEAQPMMSDDMMGDGMMTSQADGTVCNTHNSMQKNRENCWWRFHNGLPLITELPIMSDAMMDDKMMDDGM
ncbi:MAG: hypothetical protein OXC13_10910 [Caldilineaceae bacterium]|nr:hypothetical protein [Caldilineaceae bacterium]